MTISAWVLSAMLFWLPTTNPHQLATYHQVADAIAVATYDPAEAITLASIGSFESGYVLNAIGKAGEVGVYQLAPPAPKSLEAQTREALRRVRESFALCHSLAYYASGQCYRGTAAAKHRLERAGKWMVAHPFVGEETRR